MPVEKKDIARNAVDNAHDPLDSRERTAERLLGEARAALPDEVQACLPAVVAWIDRTLAEHDAVARPVAELGFPRLPRCFPETLLREARAIPVQVCPGVPLEAFGLRGDELPGVDATAGLTLRHAYFVSRTSEGDESTHFHELVHVVEWQLLGEEAFLLVYATGLLACGYRDSPLEEIAYGLQARFDRDRERLDVVEEVGRALEELTLV